MGINLIFTLVHFLKLQYSIPSKELFILAKVETQGLDLPSCLKQPKSRQNIRNDGFQDAGLWMMKASAPVRQETDNCPISLPWELQSTCRAGVTQQSSITPELRSQSWQSRKIMVLTCQNTEEQGLCREKTPEMKRVTLDNSAECSLAHAFKETCLGKEPSKRISGKTACCYHSQRRVPPLTSQTGELHDPQDVWLEHRGGAHLNWWAIN